MVLTNGKKNPNENRGASGEDYEAMKERIKSLGTVNEILSNENLVMSIIAYNGDRHFFQAFIDLVNEGLSKKEINPHDLTVFNSGKVADAIVNMDKTAEVYGAREAYPNEICDKLDYLSFINDNNSFAASFTHPKIMEAIKGNGSTELTDWMKNDTVPNRGMAAVVVEMINNGATNEALKYLSDVSYYPRRYVSANKEDNDVISKQK